MPEIDAEPTPVPLPENPLLATIEWWLVGFLAYALSIGPMYWSWFLCKYAEVGPIWIALLYEPLWIIARCVPPFGYWLDSYLRWWILG